MRRHCHPCWGHCLLRRRRAARLHRFRGCPCCLLCHPRLPGCRHGRPHQRTWSRILFRHLPFPPRSWWNSKWWWTKKYGHGSMNWLMGSNDVMRFKWVVFILQATRVKLLMMLWVHHGVLCRHLVFQGPIFFGRAMACFCPLHFEWARLSWELLCQRVPCGLRDFGSFFSPSSCPYRSGISPAMLSSGTRWDHANPLYPFVGVAASREVISIAFVFVATCCSTITGPALFELLAVL